MGTKNINTFGSILVAITILSLLGAGCAPSQAGTPSVPPTIAAVTAPPSVSPTLAPTSTEAPLPSLTFRPGEFYFSVSGTPGFIFSRNIAGNQQTQYKMFLDWAKAGGSRVARIQLDSLGMGYTKSGGVDENWAAQWDQVFDKAEADGIYVLPVFSSWFDWNAGAGYSTWKSNPLNKANGGPVKSPAELFQKDSPTQTLWMAWMQTLVKRWQGRKNILGWEVFSEVNLATGSTQSSAIDFVNSAVTVVRAADEGHRPVTASMADVLDWHDFYRETNIDFINIHPYPGAAQLDRLIITGVRAYLSAYYRPVLIGESGLSAVSPEDYPPNAEMGVRHAIWAAVVSGAMNGRALYWEDSFAIYFPNLGVPFMQKYATEELPAVKFVDGVDFSGFRPLTAKIQTGIWGAAVGNDHMVLGWFRDSASEPPSWKFATKVTNQKVTLTVPGSAANWQVDFYNTKTGTDIVSSAQVTRAGYTVTIPLPDFTEDIAFKMYVKK